MSQDAKNLYQAQQEAASMAEILEKDIDSLDNISVYYDKEGILWIGTRGGGIVYFDFRQHSICNITAKNIMKSLLR